MLTRCPSCKTTFRVTTVQLKAKLGQVRCGTCQQIFNALDALVDALPDQGKPIILAEPRAEEITPLASGATPTSTSERSFHSLLSKEDLPAFSISRKSPELSANDTTQADEPSDTADVPDIEGDVMASLLPTPRRRAWPWAIAGGLASLVLLVQVAIHYRVEIAVLAPEAKPGLETLCEITQCTVDLPSKVELLSIEVSDLHPIDPAVPNRLELSATLRNRAPFAQAWPHLELTITDTTDNAVARRVVAPGEYLSQAKGRDVANGFASQSDSPVSVQLATDGLPASGYRLYLFYP